MSKKEKISRNKEKIVDHLNRKLWEILDRTINACEKAPTRQMLMNWRDQMSSGRPLTSKQKLLLTRIARGLWTLYDEHKTHQNELDAKIEKMNEAKKKKEASANRSIEERFTGIIRRSGSNRS